VFRQRSLLFLGSGLAEPYLLDLFSQIIELYGPSSSPHFAIASRGKLDPTVPQPVFRREYSVGSPVTGGRLALDTNPLPTGPDPSGCIVLSGGGSRKLPRLSDWAWQCLVHAGYYGRVPRNRGEEKQAVNTLFVQDSEHKLIWAPRQPAPRADAPLVLIATARLDPESPAGVRINPISEGTIRERNQPEQDKPGRLWRDVRVTGFALKEALEVAHKHGRPRIASALLAAGGLRTFSPSYALLEMIRSWGRSPLHDSVSLTIHVLDEHAQLDIQSGRLDVTRLLPLPGDDPPVRPIEFWLEIAASAPDPDRALILDMPERPILDILREFGIAGPLWRVTLEPAPCLGWTGWTLAEIQEWEARQDEPLSLERIGVMHGSTVRLRRTEPCHYSTFAGRIHDKRGVGVLHL
jgi:hypothetical protein